MIVSSVARRICDAASSVENDVLRQWREGAIETEPTLTDRFLGAFEQAIGSDFLVSGYRVTTRTLRDRGPNSPEREFGADIASVLRVNTLEQQLTKGFLAQSKFANKDEIRVEETNGHYPNVTVRIRQNDINDQTSLVSQSQRMLTVTPDSFVLVYSEQGIFAMPASTIVTLKRDGEHRRVYVKEFRWFIMDFLQSFIGDLRMYAYDDPSLRQLRDLTQAYAGLLLTVENAG